VRRLLILLLLAFSAGTACVGGGGGDGRPTASDRETVAALLRSRAAIGQAAGAMFLCVEKSCYVKAGQEALPILEHEEERFAAVLSETDNECLAAAAEHHRRMAGDYVEAAQAATAGNVDAMDAAFARADDQEIAFGEKLGSCGFAEGRLAEITSKLGTTRAEIIRLSAELYECSSRSCLDSAAKRLKATAHAGTLHIDEFMAEIPKAGLADEQKTCLWHGLALTRQAYEEWEKAAKALLSRHYQAAERHGVRSQELAGQASQALATCLD
jgi:hypothetical protein